MQKIILRIETSRIDSTPNGDNILAYCHGVDVSDLLDALLSGPYQQQTIARVKEVIKEHEQIEKIDQLVNEGL